MKIVVTGGTGLIGSALEREVWAQGHRLTILTRKPRREHERRWDPAAGTIEPGALDDADCVIHLAGESIAQRWNPEVKRRILESRRQGTAVLSEHLARMGRKPKVLICASGADYYPHRDGPWDEGGPQGDVFLSMVCAEWEAAAQPARDAGIRVVHARTGAVLSPHGGALKPLLSTFKAGLGGPAGDGSQRMSWIHEADLVAAFMFILQTPSLSGPVNTVAPQIVTNSEFSKTLATALHRPAFLRAPKFALRMMLGEIADALVLADLAVTPRKLQQAGFRWKFGDLRPALDDLVDQE